MNGASSGAYSTIVWIDSEALSALISSCTSLLFRSAWVAISTLLYSPSLPALPPPAFARSLMNTMKASVLATSSWAVRAMTWKSAPCPCISATSSAHLAFASMFSGRLKGSERLDRSLTPSVSSMTLVSPSKPAIMSLAVCRAVRISV